MSRPVAVEASNKTESAEIIVRDMIAAPTEKWYKNDTWKDNMRCPCNL